MWSCPTLLLSLKVSLSIAPFRLSPCILSAFLFLFLDLCFWAALFFPFLSLALWWFPGPLLLSHLPVSLGLGLGLSLGVSADL